MLRKTTIHETTNSLRGRVSVRKNGWRKACSPISAPTTLNRIIFLPNNIINSNTLETTFGFTLLLVEAHPPHPQSELENTVNGRSTATDIVIREKNSTITTKDELTWVASICMSNYYYQGIGTKPKFLLENSMPQHSLKQTYTATQAQKIIFTRRN